MFSKFSNTCHHIALTFHNFAVGPSVTKQPTNYHDVIWHHHCCMISPILAGNWLDMTGEVIVRYFTSMLRNESSRLVQCAKIYRRSQQRLSHRKPPDASHCRWQKESGGVALWIGENHKRLPEPGNGGMVQLPSTREISTFVSGGQPPLTMIPAT